MSQNPRPGTMPFRGKCKGGILRFYEGDSYGAARACLFEIRRLNAMNLLLIIGLQKFWFEPGYSMGTLQPALFQSPQRRRMITAARR